MPSGKSSLDPADCDTLLTAIAKARLWMSDLKLFGAINLERTTLTLASHMVIAPSKGSAYRTVD